MLLAPGESKQNPKAASSLPRTLSFDGSQKTALPAVKVLTVPLVSEKSPRTDRSATASDSAARKSNPRNIRRLRQRALDRVTPARATAEIGHTTLQVPPASRAS